jgi:glucokinase
MFLGVEIGGTKLQLGIGPGDGTIIALERAKVDAAAGAERIRQQILELVPTLLANAGMSKSDIQAVGIGFGGPVDAEKGIVTKSHQIEGWAGFPLADWSRRELGWPTVVHNDADTAGLAEACFGAGRGLSPIFYITIGSGIGGGLIVDQKIYRGAGAGASEIGHLRVSPGVFMSDDHAAMTPCDDEADTVERICSGWAIEARMRAQIEKLRTQDRELLESGVDWQSPSGPVAEFLELVGGDLGRTTTAVVAEAARRGHSYANNILWEVSHVLGWAIAQVITLLCPRRIVVGGGVSLIGEDLFFDPVREEVARYVFPPFSGCFDIVPASLGEAVVVHGALRLARDSIGDER